MELLKIKISIYKFGDIVETFIELSYSVNVFFDSETSPPKIFSCAGVNSK